MSLGVKIQKFWSHIGFTPQLFFQNGCQSQSQSQSPHQSSRTQSPQWRGGLWDIKKKIYTREMPHMGACFWKWKFPKIGPPKSFSIQTRFSKIILEVRYTFVLELTSPVPELSSPMHQMYEKWWFLKIVFGSNTTLGVRFLEIFTSKNMPPSS